MLNGDYIRVPIILLGSLIVCSCGGGATVDAQQTGIPGLSVENARLVLPPIQGNPGAVYFDLAYEGDRALSIRKAEVTGAVETQIHAYGEWEGQLQMAEAMPIPIRKGVKIQFKPGEYHLMVFGLEEGIGPDETIEVTLTASGGGRYSFDADIREAGDSR